MTDLNEIIKDMTKEYLQPKYPIYKITYILSKCRIDEEEEEPRCILRKKSTIYEILPEVMSFACVVEQINFKSQMSIKCLEFYKKCKNEGDDVYFNNDTIFILDIEQLA